LTLTSFKYKTLMLCLFSTIAFMPSYLGWADEGMYSYLRKKMIDTQLIKRGIKDPKVLAAMDKVDRRGFVPASSKNVAYGDFPLPIGYGQTISQPYVVAYMTEMLNGYQAAILAEIAKEVYTIEIVKPLAIAAAKRLEGMGYKNIKVRHGDGYNGWLTHAPYDAIMVTAAPPHMPEKLVEQLKVGGYMIIPIGSFSQELYLVQKTDKGIEIEELLPVRFVPMVHDR